MAERTLETMRRSSAEFRRYATGFGMSGGTSSGDWLERAAQAASIKASETAWRFSWSDSDELLALQEQQIVIETCRTAKTNGTFIRALSEKDRRIAEARARAGRQDRDAPEHDVLNGYGTFNARSLFSDSARSVAQVPHTLMRAEVSRQMVMTAIALKRFQLRNGGFPPSLAALCPEMLPSAPSDPVDGQSLRFRLNPDGSFSLYSVGEDGQDDGGDPRPAHKTSPSPTSVINSASFTWQSGRDWVWPQPATAEEVAEYYKTNVASRHW